eukprot:34604_1
MSQVIIVGGGLAGLSACHTILERGGRVCLIEKMAFCGGNSTKATSGINGAVTRVQIANNIPDSVDRFLKDTALSGSKGKTDVPTPLNHVLVDTSADCVHWLIDKFGLDLTLLGQLGGHSFPRTHRGKERFPGMTITYCLMQAYEKICKSAPARARLLNKSRVTRLITGPDGTVVGCEYARADGTTAREYGPVLLSTGGFGADFSDSGVLASVRPDLLDLSTTNGDHCTGDGLKMVEAIGGEGVDLKMVQVHPTGLVDPKEPDAKVKFLAAEALRGCGGLLLGNDGQRFCDEMGRRDYVSGRMNDHNKFPYRLLLNSAMAEEFDWHCKHYAGRGLMKFMRSGRELAQEMGIPASQLDQSFGAYNEVARTKRDPFGKKFFKHTPFRMDDSFYVAQVVPLVHYCMGGVAIGTDGNVLLKGGKPIPGLFAAGEVTGGVHGLNRLGGSALAECVVFGRVSGASAARYLMDTISKGSITGPPGSPATGGTGTFSVTVDPRAQRVTLGWGQSSMPGAPQAAGEGPSGGRTESTAPEEPKTVEKKQFSMGDVSKHKTDTDCWVVVNGRVLDVTDFLKDHPGGKKAIMLFAGKDATEEFNMLHEPDVIEKYAPEVDIGTLKGAPVKSKL